MYMKISKAQARERFKIGKTFYVIACKMVPGFSFSQGLIIYPTKYHEQGGTFDGMVANFAFYNCSNETGRYPAFYVTKEMDVAPPCKTEELIRPISASDPYPKSDCPEDVDPVEWSRL